MWATNRSSSSWPPPSADFAQTLNFCDGYQQMLGGGVAASAKWLPLVPMSAEFCALAPLMHREVVNNIKIHSYAFCFGLQPSSPGYVGELELAWVMHAFVLVPPPLRQHAHEEEHVT